MLPLLSINNPTEIGMSSRETTQWAVACCWFTVNARWSRFVTRLPRSFNTVAEERRVVSPTGTTAVGPQQARLHREREVHP
jgi:hypothetical protein